MQLLSTKAVKILSVIFFISILSACGGGSISVTRSPVSADNTEKVLQVEKTISVSGAGVKGPLMNAKVSIYKLDTSQPELYDPNAVLSTTFSNSFGLFENLEIPKSLTPPFVLVIDGKEAIDLNTGTTPVITELFNILTAQMIDAGAKIYATPLTTMAFYMARQATEPNDSSSIVQEALDTAAKQISTALDFGLSQNVNILTFPPIIDVSTTSGEQQQKVVQHRVILEAVASVVNMMSSQSKTVDDLLSTNQLSTTEILQRLASDLQSDGIIDNTENGQIIGGIDIALLKKNPDELLIPNTQIKLNQIATILENETILRGDPALNLPKDLQLPLRPPSLSIAANESQKPPIDNENILKNDDKIVPPAAKPDNDIIVISNPDNTPINDIIVDDIVESSAPLTEGGNDNKTGSNTDSDSTKGKVDNIVVGNDPLTEGGNDNKTDPNTGTDSTKDKVDDTIDKGKIEPIENVVITEQQDDKNGLVVLEAEDYSVNLQVNGLAWVDVFDANALGNGVMIASPTNYVKIDTDYALNSPRLDYEVNFNRNGKHYIWVRGRAESGSSNSLHIGLDGVEVSTSAAVEINFGQSWTWTRYTMTGDVAYFNVELPGIHTVNAWIREAGFVLDQLLITSNPDYLPETAAKPVEDIPKTADKPVNDASLPAVNKSLLLNPQDKATDVVRNEPIHASFNKTTGISNISIQSFTVNVGGNAIDGVFEYKTEIARFFPSAPLSYNTQYTASVTYSGQDDSNGNIILNTYNWSFRTIDPNADWIILFSDFDNEPIGKYTTTDLVNKWNASSSAGIEQGRLTIEAGEKNNHGNVMRIKYEANKRGLGAGGVQWKTRIPSSNELYVSYWIKFKEGFDFVRGGKIPGLAGGTANTGGKKPNGLDGWSARMMWRPNGKAVQYLYFPDQKNITGKDFPWNVNSQKYFTPGKWYKVETRIKMNTPGKRNGIVQSWFDGELAVDQRSIRFRDVDTFAIDYFMFSTFFGGGDDSWATTKEEYAYFDNIIVSKKPITH